MQNKTTEIILEKRLYFKNKITFNFLTYKYEIYNIYNNIPIVVTVCLTSAEED